MAGKKIRIDHDGGSLRRGGQDVIGGVRWQRKMARAALASFARQGRRCYNAGAARRTARSIKKCSGGHTMAKFLITASYTADGLKGLQKDKASGRRDAVRQACESIGGKLDAFYLAFGEDDVVTIVDLPDNIAASVPSLAV
jgi:uncharacterized protein with GYD domain